VQSFAGRKINECVVKTKNAEECQPHGIAITTANHIIITDVGKHCVYVFDAEYNLKKTFGKRGSRGAKQFKCPYYVATNNNNDIVVSDYGNHSVKVFQLSNLSCKFTIGRNGSQPGQFMHPMGVCGDKFGNIFVADRDNHRIQMFDPKGHFLANILQETYEKGDDIRPLDLAMTSNSNLVVLLTGVEGVDFAQVCIYQLRSTKIPLQQHRLQQEKLRREAEERRRREEEDEAARLKAEEEATSSNNEVKSIAPEHHYEEPKPSAPPPPETHQQPSSSTASTATAARAGRAKRDRVSSAADPKKRKNSSKQRNRADASESNGKTAPQDGGIATKRPTTALPPIRGAPPPGNSAAPAQAKRVVLPDVVLKSIAESIIFDPDKCEEAETPKGEDGKAKRNTGSASSRSSRSDAAKKDPSQVCAIL
jgi:hypothetical protein